MTPFAEVGEGQVDWETTGNNINTTVSLVAGAMSEYIDIADADDFVTTFDNSRNPLWKTKASDVMGAIGNITGAIEIGGQINTMVDINSAMSRYDATIADLDNLANSPLFSLLSSEEQQAFMVGLNNFKDTRREVNGERVLANAVNGTKVAANAVLMIGGAVKKGMEKAGFQGAKWVDRVSGIGGIVNGAVECLTGQSEFEDVTLDTIKTNVDSMSNFYNIWYKRMVEKNKSNNDKTKEKQKKIDDENDKKKPDEDPTKDDDDDQSPPPDNTKPPTGPGGNGPLPSPDPGPGNPGNNKGPGPNPPGPDGEESGYNANHTHDPEGFAWSGTEDNRLAGVTAELWTADDESGANARLWTEAPDYDQINPIITSGDGYYQWFTPTGWWQVRLHKDGYSDAQSAWLPVLPIQLGVNLEMKNLGGGTTNPPRGGGGGSTAAAPKGQDPVTPPDESLTLPGGNTIITPEGQDPITNPDGSLTLPGGGTITTPGGTEITSPPGTVVGKDGQTLTLPNGSRGASISQGDKTASVDPGLTVKLTDNTVPTGGYDVYWTNPFSDVLESDWFYQDALYVYTHGLMAGTDADKYSPSISLTRGMIVTILYRHAGSPAVSALANPFSDAAGKYYTDAVKWAAANNIIAGVGGGYFEPETPVTRQDLAVILNRYAGFSGMKLPAARSYAAFNDDADIADYAKNAVQTLYGGGIVSGKGNNIFDPRGESTRAEVASMLHRFLEAAGK
jgi:hypothetical protein